MVCAAIDIGSNTTRLLVAEPRNGQLRKLMEQRAYTRISSDARDGAAISSAKVTEVAEVVSRQVRLARELDADAVRIVATAAIRDAANGREAAAKIAAACGEPVDVLDAAEEGRLAFVGATKTLGHPVVGDVGVVDVGGGSTEVVVGSVAEGVRLVESFKVGSGSLTEDFVRRDPPAPAELRRLRDHIDSRFAGVDVPTPRQAVAVGGSATSLRALVGAVLEHETLERAIRVLSSASVAEVARRFELDPRRVRVLPAGVLLLEKLSELLRQPLQIGKGGLREGVILDLLAGSAGGAAAERVVA